MFRAALAKFNEGLALVGRGIAAIEPYKVSGSVILVLLSIWVIGMVGDALVHPRQQAAVAVASVGGTDKPTKKEEEKPLEPVGPLLASADTAKGEKVFKKCGACHTTNKGGANKVGPNLWNIVNAKRGQVEGFSYSKNLCRRKRGTWSYESLNAFLFKPKTYIPGTKMAFAGLKKPSDRANLIAYLRSLSENPAPLP